MKNTVSKKILTGALLTAFALSNSSLPVLAFGGLGYLKNINESLISQNVEGIRGFNSSSVIPDVYSGVTSGIESEMSTVKPTETIKLRGATSLTEKKIPVTLSLRDSDLQQVLRMFADKAGLNIIFDNDVHGSVTMDMVDVPINDAFELIMELNKLFYFIDDNNTLVIYSGDAKNAVNMKELIAIPVKYVDALPMASFLNKNIFGLGKPGLSGVMVATTNPRKNEVLIFGTQNDAEMARRIIAQFDTKPENKTYKVNHVTPDAMADMICTQLLPTIIDAEAFKKKSSSGHITGAAASKNNTITIGGGEIACSYTSSMKTKSSNKGSKSVIEFESLPLMALEVAYSPGLGTINVVGATPQQFALIEEFIKRNDKKEPQAYLEISIIELSEEGSRTFDNAWYFFSKNFSASFSKGGGIKADPIYLIDHGHYRENMQEVPPGDHIRGGLVWVLNYLIDNKKGRVVANPRILITNAEESTIDLTSDYVKTVTSQVVQGVQQATSQKDYEIGDDNGIKVEITPFISPDGYVTLDITPDYATIKDREYATNEAGEQELVATLLQRRNLELKKVRIKDGETLIIGGMLREEETKNVSKIPFLGDIPYLGALFRSTSTTKSKEEMVIMITPKIITDNEDSVSEQETL